MGTEQARINRNWTVVSSLRFLDNDPVATLCSQVVPSSGGFRQSRITTSPEPATTILACCTPDGLHAREVPEPDAADKTA